MSSVGYAQLPKTLCLDRPAGSVLFTLLGFPNGLSLCNTGNFLDIVGGSGGPSFVYRKPFWQSAVFGVPADGKRDLPDASLFASNGVAKGRRR
jgi:hypothetical protein